MESTVNHGTLDVQCRWVPPPARVLPASPEACPSSLLVPPLVSSGKAVLAVRGGLTARVAERRGRRHGSAAASARITRNRSSTGLADQSYLNVTGYPFPLGPITKRATIRKDIVKGVIWGFEQPQSLGGSNVTTNVSKSGSWFQGHGRGS